jgi:TolB-like protein
MRKCSLHVGASLIFALLLLTPLQVLGQDLRAGVEQLATQVGQGAPGGKTLRVAVVDFPDLQGVVSDLGRFIASRLTTRLAQSPKFSVIERQRLGQVLAELRFSMSDLVDPTKAKQLGRMAGVEAIVVGTIADLGNQVDLDARMIEIETNRMLLGATVSIGKDPTVTAMLERGRAEPSATRATGGPEPSSGTTPAAAHAKVDSVEGFVFQPRGCRKRENRITCRVAIINTTKEDRVLQIYSNQGSPPGALIDEESRQYPHFIAIVESQGGYVREVRLAPEVPTGVSFITEPTDAEPTRMTVVIGIAGFKRLPVVRDMPVTK